MLEEQARAAKKGLHQVDLTFLGYDCPEAEWVMSLKAPWLSGFARELDKVLAKIRPERTHEPRRGPM